MKYLFGFAVAILIVGVFRMLKLDEFLTGWFGCMGYYTIILIYDHNNKNDE